MTAIQIAEKVKILETRIEELKWGLAQLAHRPASQSKVKATFGILGKKFPSGTTYENHIRKSWRKRSN